MLLSGFGNAAFGDLAQLRYGDQSITFNHPLLDQSHRFGKRFDALVKVGYFRSIRAEQDDPFEKKIANTDFAMLW